MTSSVTMARVREVAWERGVREHRSSRPIIPGDDISGDEVAVVEMTEDLIALSQRYSDTGQVGTIWLSRAQWATIDSLMH